ncbi:MAG: TRAP transporter substrate-binding protein [Oscillospiraceae bacterium]|nr:TRAP transporter substrate-binding protein [Oscillospiraceae bacterium]
MMKKVTTTALALALALSICLGLAGCGKKQGDGDPSGGSGGNNANDLGYFEFSLSMHDPVTTPNALYFQQWADDIFAATDGHVKIKIFGSGTLAAATDVADMVRDGGCNIGWLYTSYYAGQFPLSEVINLPMQGFGDPVVSTRVLWDLYDEYAEVRAEWDAYKLLMLYGNPGMIFASAKAPITTVADLAGLSLRCPAGAITNVLTAWGANPITMPPPDIYQAIEKNNISGYIFEPSGITNFSLEEVTKYYTDLPMYDGPFGLIMNKASWDSLPAKYQEIMDNYSGFNGSMGAAQTFADAVDVARGVITAAGGEFVSVAPDALAEFQIEADAYASGWAGGIGGNIDAAGYLAKAKELARRHS